MIKKKIKGFIFLCLPTTHLACIFLPLPFPFPLKVEFFCTPVLAVLSRTLILRSNAKNVCDVFKDVYSPFFLSLAAHTVREGSSCSYGCGSSAYQSVPLGMPVFLQQLNPNTGMRKLSRIGLTAGKPAHLAEKSVILQRGCWGAQFVLVLLCHAKGKVTKKKPDKRASWDLCQLPTKKIMVLSSWKYPCERSISMEEQQRYFSPSRTWRKEMGDATLQQDN